jgi:hypothetical protein
MKSKSSTKPKSQPSHQKTTSKAMPAKSKNSSRGLVTVVGPEVYGSWVSMLRVLVPDGRTHRIAPLVAAMLQYAASIAEADDDDDDSIANALIESTEAVEVEEVEKLLHDAVRELFKDAGVEFKRTNARGEGYSIAETAYEEYIHWYDMPWEW